MKLHLGCGTEYLDGWVNIDNSPHVHKDIVMDLENDDLVAKLGENVVEKVYTSHLLEHLRDPFRLVEQIWRVCKNGAELVIIVPHRDAEIGNPYHKWPFFTEWTFRFFDPVGVIHPQWGKIGRGTANEASPVVLSERSVSVQHGSITYLLTAVKT